METRPPTVTRILVAAGFVLSCFALALFLWLAFGGPVPLKPEGYRVEVPVDEAVQLAQESDVRISGVSVGEVKRIDLDDSGVAIATIELDSTYAPIPSDTRAVLRQKTLLGETYIELTPGSDEAESLPEGGRLEAAQVAHSVQLDEIFRTFDSRTRSAFRTWLQGAAGALRGRGEDLSVALASLDSFAVEARRALRILDSQKLAVRGLVNGGGEVFGALSERSGQLSGLIRNTNAVFETTARRNRDLQELFTVLPTFLRESRQTLTRLDSFAAEADPVITQLRPAAQELAPTLDSTASLATELDGFLAGFREATNAAPRGFPALRRLLSDDLTPLLGRLDPFLDQLTPILSVLGDYRHEVTAVLGNLTAVTNATNDEGAGQRNYLRTLAPFAPDILSAYPNRLRSNRTNPYMRPQAYKNLLGGLKSFETRQCTSGINSILDQGAATNPDFYGRLNDDPAEVDDAQAQAQDLLNRIKEFVFTNQNDSNSVPQPGCNKQAPFSSVGGGPEESTDYQHVRELP